MAVRACARPMPRLCGRLSPIFPIPLFPGLGAGCLLLASMLYFTVSQARPVIHELIIAVFLLLTAPVVAMTIMRAAVYRDLRARKRESGVTAGEVYILSDSGKEGPPEPR